MPLVFLPFVTMILQMKAANSLSAFTEHEVSIEAI
jgi:hypothetical protein